MATQRDQAIQFIRAHEAPLGQVNALAQALGYIVGQAQNGPPHGESDGSIDQIDFETLRDAARDLEKHVARLRYLARFPAR